MTLATLIFVASALSPVVAYAHVDPQEEGMHDEAGGRRLPNDGHGQAVGKLGEPKKVSRTIHVLMSDDMKFTPANINVKRGETIMFVLRNVGRVKHEMMIGPLAELKKHAELMRKFPGMQHSDPNMVTLAPGQTGNLIWQFTEAGPIDFACLRPGHFEAGMRGSVLVH